MDLLKQQEQIKTILAKAKRRLQNNNSTDRLAISKSNGYIQFYSRDENGKKHYLSSDNKAKIQELAQKAYDTQIIRELTKEENCLSYFIKNYNPNKAVEILESFPPQLRSVIKPLAISDRTYAQQWDQEPAETKGISDGARYYVTDNGEKVRSKSELTIANKLHSRGIKYIYEEPHYMKGYGTIYPDFTVLNAKTREEIIWEHFGLMDNPEYAETCVRKLNTYAENGLYPGHGLIITCESESTPVNTRILDMQINTFLIE